MGVPEVTWDLKAVEYVKLANLALDWVEGKPVAYLRTWPWPARGAVTLGVDALWRFENVPRISDAMAKAGVQGSFHYLSVEAVNNAAAIRELLKAGHSLGAFGDSTEPFAGQPDGEQRGRIERIVRAFRAADPAFVVAGLRAPQGATDAGTEKATAALDYLVDTGRVDSLVPVPAPGGRPVVLTAALNLDSNASPEAVDTGLDGIAKKAELLGGYAFVGLDVAAYEAGGPLEAGLGRYLAGAKERSIWHASAVDVARWWHAREGLKVETRADATGLTIDIDAAEAVPFPAAIALSPPPGMKEMRVDVPPSAGGVQNHRAPDGSVALVLTALPAGKHSIRVTFAY
jgi:peptidoglycan/xylan/chitin deacetylase (PgdA/CDA1 family)